MTSFEKSIARGLTTLGLAFAASACAPVADPAAEKDWYEKLRPLSFLKQDPEGKCVPAARVQNGANADATARATRMLDILSRSDITARTVKDLKQMDGAICFANFTKEYGEGITAGAMFFPSYGAILINTAVAEGCQISASIHETHHASQKVAGFEAPLRDLTIDDQNRLVHAVEVDAHVIQTLGSWKLTQAWRPYRDAFDCIKTDPHKNLPYLAEAGHKLEEIVKNNPAAVASGEAPKQLHDHFAANAELRMRYKEPTHVLYDPMMGPEHFVQRHTLEKLDIDLGGIGKIHYPHDYRVTPKPSR